MKIIILTFLLRGSISDTLPPSSDLFHALRAFHAENADANAAALNIVEAKAWTQLLPTVGITLGLPKIDFSVGQYFNFKQQQRLRKAEKSKILRGSLIAFKSDSFAIVALLERHEALRNALPILLSAERTANARFEIEKKLNAKGLLPAPFGWLDAQAANLRSGEAVRLKLEEIELLEIEVRKTAKY